MSKRTPATICVRCNDLIDDHFLVNHADGPFVGQNILVCPRNTFLSIDSFYRQAALKTVDK